MITSAKPASWSEFQRRCVVTENTDCCRIGDWPQRRVTKPPSQST